MNHLQRTVSQAREKSNLALICFFIYFQSAVSFQPFCESIIVLFQKGTFAFLPLFCFQWLGQTISTAKIFSPSTWHFGILSTPEYTIRITALHPYLSHTHAYIQTERWKDERVDKRRQSNTSTCHLNLSISQSGFLRWILVYKIQKDYQRL